MSPSEELLPSRSWDELLHTSRRRGRALRRRRRLALASPVLGVAVALAALPLALGSGGSDTLIVPPADTATAQPTPVPSDDVTVPSAQVGPAAPTRLAGRGGAAEPAPDAGRAPREPVRQALRRDVPTRAPAAPLPRPPAFTPTVVAFDDATGDAEPTGGQAGGVASEPRHDIVRMRFVAERDGVRVRMVLAADRSADGAHFARLFTDDGCELVLLLGREDDLYATRCGSTGPYSDYFAAPPTTDPSPRELEMFLPYDAFPPAVRPSEPLSGLRGETRLPHAIGGTTLVDAATGPGGLPGRRS